MGCVCSLPYIKSLMETPREAAWFWWGQRMLQSQLEAEKAFKGDKRAFFFINVEESSSKLDLFF